MTQSHLRQISRQLGVGYLTQPPVSQKSRSLTRWGTLHEHLIRQCVSKFFSDAGVGRQHVINDLDLARGNRVQRLLVMLSRT
jgi:hypothetical protein